MDGTTITIWEKERARVGEKEELDVLSAPITDGWEMQKEEKDSLTTDNKKQRQQKTAVTKTTFWGLQGGVLAPRPQLPTPIVKKEKHE